jgi:hypothetical protein
LGLGALTVIDASEPIIIPVIIPVHMRFDGHIPPSIADQIAWAYRVVLVNNLRVLERVETISGGLMMLFDIDSVSGMTDVEVEERLKELGIGPKKVISKKAKWRG